MATESFADFGLDRMRRTVWTALFQLHARDGYLLKHGIHERAMSHRVAVYLEYQFPGWSVDCEYNKYGDKPKLSPVAKKSKRPDIIVHRRGLDEDNLLAVELKKMRSICQQDHDKMAAAVSSLRYRWAICVSVHSTGAMIEWQGSRLATPDLEERMWASLDGVPHEH